MLRTPSLRNWLRSLQEPQERGRRQAFVGGILLVSLAVRLAFAWARDAHLVSDMVDYHLRALLLLDEGTFRTDDFRGSTYHPPLYTVFLAGVYFVFGRTVRAAYLVQAVLGTSMLLALYLQARRLAGTGVGLLTLVLAALYLPFAGYVGVLLPETLFVALLVWATYLAVRGALTLHPPGVVVAPGPVAWFAGAGALLGLASLTRSVALPVGLLVAAWVMLVRGRGNLRPWILRSAVMVVAMGLVIAPWTLRNAREQQAFVPIDTVGGLNLLIGNNDYSWGLYDERFADTPGYRRAFAEGTTPAEVDSIMRAETVRWIGQHPGRFAVLTVARLGMALGLYRDWVGRFAQWELLMGGPWIAPIGRVIVAASQWAVMLAGLAGGYVALRRRGPLLLPVLLAGYVIGVMAVFYVQVRYRLPAMPYVVLLAAYGLVVRRRHPRW